MTLCIRWSFHVLSVSGRSMCVAACLNAESPPNLNWMRESAIHWMFPTLDHRWHYTATRSQYQNVFFYTLIIVISRVKFLNHSYHQQCSVFLNSDKIIVTVSWVFFFFVVEASAWQLAPIQCIWLDCSHTKKRSYDLPELDSSSDMFPGTMSGIRRTYVMFNPWPDMIRARLDVCSSSNLNDYRSV